MKYVNSFEFFEGHTNFFLNEEFDVEKAMAKARELGQKVKDKEKEKEEKEEKEATKSSGGVSWREGSKGAEVTAIQSAVDFGLGASNFSSTDAGKKEKADKVFGPKTKEAVIAFQKRNGLPTTGIVGPKTIKKMADLKDSKGLEMGGWSATMLDKMAKQV